MSATAWNLMSLAFAVWLVWMLLLLCSTFCNRRAFVWLHRARKILDTQPLDQVAWQATWERVEIWSRRDLYLFKALSLGLFKEPSR